MLSRCYFSGHILFYVEFYIFLSFKLILFQSFDIFRMLPTKYTLYTSCTKNYLEAFMIAWNLSFVPTNVIHSEKRWENSFVVKLFHREGRTIKQGYIQVTVNTISLGMPHATQLDISKLPVCTPFNFVFRAPYFCLHKLGAYIYIVSMFSFALLLWIMRPPPVG